MSDASAAPDGRLPARPERTRGARVTNLARVLREVVRSPRPVSRAEVAGLAEVTRATASRLVDDLLSRGLLEEQARSSEGAPGRPGTPLTPRSRHVAALGLQIDVGGLAATVVDLRGDVLAHRADPLDLRSSDAASVLGRLRVLADEVWAESGAGVRCGVRLAVPGIVAGGRRLLRAPNLGWSDVDVPEVLAGTTGSEHWRDAGLVVGNEADLATATVAWERPGVPGAIRDFVYLSGEIGIGGSIVVDGRPLPGRHGWAGEVGHVSVDPAGPDCRCGSTGCLEQYAGRAALAAAAGMPADARPAEILSRAEAGDAQAAAALDRAHRALGHALADVVNVVDVPVIVLGGHLRELGEVGCARIEASLRTRVLSADWVPPRVMCAPDHPAPGALGAAYLELEAALDDPTRFAPTTAPA